MTASPFARLLCAATLAWLGGCGGDKETAPVDAPSSAPAASVPGLSATLQPLYDTYCKVCHGARGTGAPLSGSIADWQQRATAGMPVLMRHSIEGYNGMPPMGGCFTCTEEDLRALIAYMSAGLAQ